MKYIDMHCDTIAEIFYARENGHDSSLYENNLHIDIQKLKKGDCLVQNFAAFVNISSRKEPFKYTNELIDVYYEQLEANKELIAPVYKFEDIEKNEKAGLISALLTVEEGQACEGKVENLSHFYNRGVRMMNWLKSALYKVMEQRLQF